jgi:Cytochrome c oxidase subunit VII
VVEGACAPVDLDLLGMIELTRKYYQTHRSAYILYPYYTLLYGSLAATTYAMCRMVLVSVSPVHLAGQSTYVDMEYRATRLGIETWRLSSTA